MRLAYGAALLSLAGCATPQDTNAPAELLYVGNKAEDTVSVIDLASGEELRRLPTGPEPHELAASPDGREVAIGHYGANSLGIVDVATGEMREVDLGANTKPHGVVWHPSGDLFATTEGTDTIVRVRGEAVESFPTEARGSHMMVVSADGDTAWVANMESDTVGRIDLATGRVTEAPAGEAPEGIALLPNESELWVSARESDTVHVFDADTLEPLARIDDVGEFPLRLVISPDGAFAVTSDLASGSLTVIDTATRETVRTILLDEGRRVNQVTILFSADGERLYVAETGRDRVAELDFGTGEVLRRFAAGDQSDGLALARR